MPKTQTPEVMLAVHSMTSPGPCWDQMCAPSQLGHKEHAVHSKMKSFTELKEYTRQPPAADVNPIDEQTAFTYISLGKNIFWKQEWKIREEERLEDRK